MVASFREKMFKSGELQQKGDFTKALTVRREAFLDLRAMSGFSIAKEKGLRDLAWLQLEMGLRSYCLGLNLAHLLFSFAIAPRASFLAIKQFWSLQMIIRDFRRRKCKKKNYVYVRKLADFRKNEAISVALVGSGKIESKLGPRIDSYDLVARVGITDLDHKGSSDRYGEKTNLIFLNGDQTNKIERNNVQEYINKQIFLIHRGTDEMFAPSPFVREVENQDFIFSVSSLLTGVRALVDLMRIGNAEIHVYGMDFYSSRGTIWFPGYRDREYAERMSEIKNRAGHDLLTSITFAKYLLENTDGRIYFFDSRGIKWNPNVTFYANSMTKQFK